MEKKDINYKEGEDLVKVRNQESTVLSNENIDSSNELQKENIDSGLVLESIAQESLIENSGLLAKIEGYNGVDKSDINEAKDIINNSEQEIIKLKKEAQKESTIEYLNTLSKVERDAKFQESIRVHRKKYYNTDFNSPFKTDELKKEYTKEEADKNWEETREPFDELYKRQEVIKKEYEQTDEYKQIQFLKIKELEEEKNKKEEIEKKEDEEYNKLINKTKRFFMNLIDTSYSGSTGRYSKHEKEQMLKGIVRSMVFEVPVWFDK